MNSAVSSSSMKRSPGCSNGTGRAGPVFRRRGMSVIWTEHYVKSTKDTSASCGRFCCSKSLISGYCAVPEWALRWHCSKHRASQFVHFKTDAALLHNYVVWGAQRIRVFVPQKDPVSNVLIEPLFLCGFFGQFVPQCAVQIGTIDSHPMSLLIDGDVAKRPFPK